MRDTSDPMGPNKLNERVGTERSDGGEGWGDTRGKSQETCRNMFSLVRFPGNYVPRKLWYNKSG